MDIQMRATDITEKVEFSRGDIYDGEALPIRRCVCGAKFDGWEFIISIYPDIPHTCPVCNRKLYFVSVIRVYEVISQ